MEVDPTRAGKVACQTTPGDLAPVHSLSPVTITLRRLLFTGKTHTLTLAGRSGHGVLDKLHGPVGHGRADRGTPDKSHPTANGPLLPQERTLGLGMSALAAEGMQFSWCWNGGTISLNLGVIWEMSV